MKPQKSGLKRFSLIVPLALTFALSGQVQTLSNTTKDSVVISKKIVEIPGKAELKPVIVQQDKDVVYTVIEKMPQFPGGEKALLDYIGHNLKYPVDAQEKGIQGRIIVRFVVTKSGKVEKAEILRGLDPSLDKAGLAVVSSLPDWIPGEQKGEKVSVYYTLPITFKLTGGSSSGSPTKPNIIDPKQMPVFVLDGKVLPKEFNLNSINKDSIQNVNVIKPDTEIKKTEMIAKYGENAANGVVEITSKK